MKLVVDYIENGEKKREAHDLDFGKPLSAILELWRPIEDASAGSGDFKRCSDFAGPTEHTESDTDTTETESVS